MGINVERKVISQQGNVYLNTLKKKKVKLFKKEKRGIFPHHSSSEFKIAVVSFRRALGIGNKDTSYWN